MDDDPEDPFWNLVLASEEDIIKEHAAQKRAVGAAAGQPSLSAVTSGSVGHHVASLSSTAAHRASSASGRPPRFPNNLPDGRVAPLSSDGNTGIQARTLQGQARGRAGSNLSPGRPTHHAIGQRHFRNGLRQSVRGTAGSEMSAAPEDSYSRLIREKDAQMKSIVLSKDGEIANLRNRMRSLCSQLEARPSPSAQVIESNAEERSKLSKELAVSKAELRKLSEKLLFAQQELDASREQEKRRVSLSQAIGSVGGLRPGSMARLDQVVSQKKGGLTSSDFPEPGMLGEAAGSVPMPMGSQLPGTSGDFVDGTQIAPSNVNGTNIRRVGYEMPRGPRRTVRRRPVTATDPAGGAASLHVRGAESQGVSPSQVASRLVLSGDDMPPPSSAPPPSTPGSGSKRPRSPEPGLDLPVLDLDKIIGEDVLDILAGSDTVHDARVLRQAVFGNGKAENLLIFASSMNLRDLHRAIARAMASEAEWVQLMEPLSAYCHHKDLVALESLCSLLRNSKACRRALVTDCKLEEVVERLLKALEDASAVLDSERASLALQSFSCIVSEIALLDNEEDEADKCSQAVSVRHRIECGSVLLWLQQKEAGHTDACQAAAGISFELIASILGTPILTRSQHEFDFLEQAVLCFAAILPDLNVDASIRKYALCALDWTSQTACYLLDDKDARVFESVCSFCIEILHRLGLTRLLNKEARSAFCELFTEGSIGVNAPGCWDLACDRRPNPMTGLGAEDAQVAAVLRVVSIARRLVDRELPKPNHATFVTGPIRNVALGVLSGLAWPSKESGGTSTSLDITACSTIRSDIKLDEYLLVPNLLSNEQLKTDARIVFEALLVYEPPMT